MPVQSDYLIQMQVKRQAMLKNLREEAGTLPGKQGED